MAERIVIRCHPLLRVQIEQAAKYPLTLNDVVNTILAEHFKKPELGVVPKKRMGRPPKERTPAA